jgi:hypothetical protein
MITADPDLDWISQGSNAHELHRGSPDEPHLLQALPDGALAFHTLHAARLARGELG